MTTPLKSLNPSPESHRWNFASERGASPASVIILMVGLFMFAELIVLGGRVAAAHNDVSSAAREAARQASVLQYSSSVNTVARDAAKNNLDATSDHCRTPEVSTVGTSFRQDGHVKVKVTCKINLSDFSYLTLPWPEKLISAEATESVETYRAVD